mmetsp:Transcript_34109/g.66435  ORF Transcript_34109/g.66435 Transcript_34109/m.66435 type:complete len:80 (-) Transcript_34109:48-287(-)
MYALYENKPNSTVVGGVNCPARGVTTVVTDHVSIFNATNALTIVSKANIFAKILNEAAKYIAPLLLFLWDASPLPPPSP